MLVRRYFLGFLQIGFRLASFLLSVCPAWYRPKLGKYIRKKAGEETRAKILDLPFSNDLTTEPKGFNSKSNQPFEADGLWQQSFR